MRLVTFRSSGLRPIVEAVDLGIDAIDLWHTEDFQIELSSSSAISWKNVLAEWADIGGSLVIGRSAPQLSRALVSDEMLDELTKIVVQDPADSPRRPLRCRLSLIHI